MSAVKFTCRSDFSHHCGGVPPGGPEALTCLQSHEATLSQDCKTSLADIADFVPAPAASAPVAATTAAPAARKPMPPGITPAGRVRCAALSSAKRRDKTAAPHIVLPMPRMRRAIAPMM